MPTLLEQKCIEDAPLANLLDARLSCELCRSSNVAEGVRHTACGAGNGGVLNCVLLLEVAEHNVWHLAGVDRLCLGALLVIAVGDSRIHSLTSGLYFVIRTFLITVKL